MRSIETLNGFDRGSAQRSKRGLVTPKFSWNFSCFFAKQSKMRRLLQYFWNVIGRLRCLRDCSWVPHNALDLFEKRFRPCRHLSRMFTVSPSTRFFFTHIFESFQSHSISMYFQVFSMIVESRRSYYEFTSAAFRKHHPTWACSTRSTETLKEFARDSRRM